MYINNQPLRDNSYLVAFRSSIWCIGFAIGLFTVVSQAIVSMTDGYLSAIDLTRLVVASLIVTAWICLKPQSLVVARAVVNNSDSTI